MPRQVMTFVRLLAVAGIAAATVAPASAQTTQAVSTVRQPSNATAQPPRITELQYQNADPLHGIYTTKPMIKQCGDQPVVGPMPKAEPGSLESQPGYNFLTDVDQVGMACRKAM